MSGARPMPHAVDVLLVKWRQVGVFLVIGRRCRLPLGHDLRLYEGTAGKQLGQDTLVASLRRPMPEDPLVNEPQCQAALARAESILDEVLLGGAPTVTMSPSGLPSQLGEYELLGELGVGGMGAVYRAKHVVLERVVAIKILTRERMEDPQAIARFQREIRAVGQLNHPNIVQAFDAREVQGVWFLAMELVEGASLAELVKRQGPLRMADACELVRQAAVGLQSAHERGLVHRDIKPSNLMLTRDGQVKILDFGLALLRMDQAGGEEMTRDGQIMGTARYVAPEQVFDSHNVDIRADVYSLGCTLYKLLTGQVPSADREGGGAKGRLPAHGRQPIPAFRFLRADVPEALAAILDRMMSKNAAERYSTPSEVADAMCAFVAGHDLPGLLADAVTPSNAADDHQAVIAPAAKILRSMALQSRAVLPEIPRESARLWRAMLPDLHFRRGHIAPLKRTRRPAILIALGLLPLVAALGVVIWINRTRLEVPDGSEVNVAPFQGAGPYWGWRPQGALRDPGLWSCTLSG